MPIDKTTDQGTQGEDAVIAMAPRLLMIIAIVFFLFWRRAADAFLLFGALFALGLWICVVIQRMEAPPPSVDDDTA